MHATIEDKVTFSFALKKLIIHIGLPKTGTTSLRSFYHSNRSYLNDKNIFLPFLGEKQWNKRIQNIFRKNNEKRFCSDPVIDFIGSRPLSTQEKASIKRDGFKKLVSFAEQLPQESTMILSSEFLSAKSTAVFKLKNYAEQYFDSVCIIAYLREQGSWALSSSSTRALNGSSYSILKPGDRKTMDYKFLLSKWFSIFDSAHWVVRRYDRKFLKDQDIISDFIHSLDLPLDIQKIERQTDARLTESATAIKYLFCMNYLIENGDIQFDDNIDRRKDYVKKICESHRDGSKLALSSECASLFRQHYAKSNQWAFRKFFKDDKLELFPPYRAPDPDTVKVLYEYDLLVDPETIKIVLDFLRSN